LNADRAPAAEGQRYSGITFKHLLLPVYAGAYRFNRKVFQLVINGRSGEIHGDRPCSSKIALFVITILFALWILVLVIEAANK